MDWTNGMDVLFATSFSRLECLEVVRELISALRNTRLNSEGRWLPLIIRAAYVLQIVTNVLEKLHFVVCAAWLVSTIIVNFVTDHHHRKLLRKSHNAITVNFRHAPR